MRKYFRRSAAVMVTLILLVLPGYSQAQTSLDPLLEPYLEQYELPALAAAVVKNGRIVAAGAVGTRRSGENIPVTVNDRFHIGSNTKAMTALLAAMLVEEGKLRWTSTVAEVFPELEETMAPSLRTATLEQLLSHTSGLGVPHLENEMMMESFRQEGNLDELRYWLIGRCCREPLATEPGVFSYSNMGYVFAGAFIERATGRTWEELMVEKIFRPLAMETAGLGWQSSLGKMDAPLGHLAVNGNLKAMLAGPSGDNPALIGPAGTAHMSVLDFARWAGWNAGEGTRPPALVAPETVRRLHSPLVAVPMKKPPAPGTPAGGMYALGWLEVTYDWAPRPLSRHDGSNGLNLARIYIDREIDCAIVLMTNIGGVKADQGLGNLAAKLYARFGKE